MEAAKIGYVDLEWPKQYRSAKMQLVRNLERERAASGTTGDGGAQ
jgi:anthraniloyl-CoA monooxygenase